MDRTRVDLLDAGAGERAVGQDADLVAEQRHRAPAFGVDRERDQADAHLLARRRDHVELALVGALAHLLGEREQAVGLARHRRHNDHHLVALALGLEAAARDRPDALDRADRGTAEFLHDEQGARVFLYPACGVKGQRDTSRAWPTRSSCTSRCPTPSKRACWPGRWSKRGWRPA